MDFTGEASCPYPSRSCCQQFCQGFCFEEWWMGKCLSKCLLWTFLSPKAQCPQFLSWQMWESGWTGQVHCDFGLWMLCRTFLSWSVGIPRPEGIVSGQSFEEINPCFGQSQSLYVKQHRQFIAHGLCAWVIFPFPPFLATSAKIRCKSKVLQKSAHRKKNLSSQNLGKL